MSRQEAVLVERASAGIALITLNRPHARNAVDAAVTHGLDAAVRWTNENATIRVVVLTGAGTAFCAGADLKAAIAGEGSSLSTAQGGFAGFVRAKRTKPWIAAVNGPAVAGGFELVLACDLAIAAQAAVFGLPETSRGLVAAAGGVTRLPRVIPRAIAIEMILTGRTIEAEEALALGLVSRIVSGEELQAHALELAEAISRNAPLAVQESLRIAKLAHDLSENELDALCDEVRSRISRTADYREGALAFVEKRPPRWVGL